MRRIKRLLGIISAGIVSTSSLFILAPTVHATADTCTWTGGGADTNINTAGNWSVCDNGNVPEDGDSLIFPVGVTNRNIVMNVPLSINAITFNGDATTPCGAMGYSISGASTLTITGIITASHTGTCAVSTVQTVTAPVVIGGSVVLNASASATSEVLDLTGSSVTGANNLYTRGATLRVTNVAQTVNLGIENGGEIEYNVASCTNAIINSRVDLSNQAKLIVQHSATPCNEFTINNVGLNVNSSLDADYATVTINTLTGTPSYALTVPDGSATKILVDGATLEGAYLETTYAASGSSSFTLNEKNVGIVTGTYGLVIVNNLAKLKGNGTVGGLTINTGATLAPGMSPGCLNSGNLTLAGTYQVEVQGATACTNYDQMKVTGTVNVTGGTLSLATTGFVPTNGQKFVIIDNDGTADAVTGTFTGLAEGATIVDGGVTYTISYVGGDGNDVELTVTAVNAAAIPGAPNTGFKLLTANPLVTLLGGLLAAAGFGILARRQFANNK